MNSATILEQLLSYYRTLLSLHLLGKLGESLNPDKSSICRTCAILTLTAEKIQ